jgi:hypothetical protein
MLKTLLSPPSVHQIVAKYANAMLEEIDRECTILKEVIRSSHVEMKGKDSDPHVQGQVQGISALRLNEAEV